MNNIDITNHLNEISDINQNIQQFARRALDLRAQMLQDTSIMSQIFTVKSFRSMIFSPLCFVYSLSLLLILFSFLHYLVATIPLDKFTLSYLESEDAYLTFIVIFVCFSILTWNLYLFFSLTICNNDLSDLTTNNQKTSEILTADLIYYNPVIYCFLVLIFNKNYLRTGFDVFSWAVFSTKFFLNFGFTTKLYVYANLKINSITNTTLSENHQMMKGIRMNYLFLIIMNVAFTFIIREFIEDTGFMFKYFLMFKGVYLLCKQLEFLLINEMSYKYLHWGTTMKEENLIRNLSIKSKLQLVNMLLILHKLIFSTFVILYSGTGLYFFFPLLVVIINLCYNIYNNFTSFRRVQNFYNKLDVL